MSLYANGVSDLKRGLISTCIRTLYFGFHLHINGVFGQQKLCFKAQYTRIRIFIHKKYAPTQSVLESFSPVHKETLNMYDLCVIKAVIN